MRSVPSSPVRRRIWGLGFVGLPAYAGVAALSFSFRYGEGYRERPIILVLALFGVATLCYLLAVAGVLRQEADNPEMDATASAREDRRLTLVVLFFALTYRLVLLPSVPIQEIDFYRYLWDGRTCVAGVNPYRYSPFRVEYEGPTASDRSELATLWRLQRESATTATVFERVHHREVPTVYPPAAQAVFAAAAWITPAADPLWIHVLVLKALLVGFDVAALAVLIALLRQLGLPAAWCLAYGWCPLGLKEFANSGHLDSIAVFFTVLAMFLLVRATRNDKTYGKASAVAIATVALMALGMAVLAKSYPVILLPVVVAYLAAKMGPRCVLPLAAFVTVVVAGYLPFCGSAPKENVELLRAPNAMTSAADPAPQRTHHPWTGLGTFLYRWQMNDFLFMLAHENLRRPQAEPSPWFVVVPQTWREWLHRDYLQPALEASTLPSESDPAFLPTQALMGLILVALAGSLGWGVFHNPEPVILMRGVFLTLAWGWLLSSAQNPWYLLWSLPFIVFAGRRSWFLLTGLAFIYYLRFWLEYHAPDADGARADACALFDFQLVWLEFLPFFLALTAESVWQRFRKVESPTPQAHDGGKPLLSTAE